MPRAIYQKAIYRRPNQLTRNVYKRANNVIPVDSGKYIVSSVTLTNGGQDYVVDDELTITGTEGDTPAVITVKSVTAPKYTVDTATAAGTMSGYISDETITILGAEGDTAAVLTITADDGVITALTVTNAGEYASNIEGEITTYEYTGAGEGLELSVTTAETTSGTILTFEYTEGLYASNGSGSKTLSSTTGSGATFNVTMIPQIVGDDEDISNSEEA